MQTYPDKGTARYMDTSVKALSLDIISDVFFCAAEDMLTGRCRPTGYNWNNIPSQRDLLVELLFQRTKRRLAKKDATPARAAVPDVQSIAPPARVKKPSMSLYERRKAKQAAQLQQ